MVEAFGGAFDEGLDDAPEALVQELPAPDEVDRVRPVLVTGAAGLVGTSVCRELAARGLKIRAVVRDTVKAAMRLAGVPADVVVADLRDRDAVRNAVHGVGAIVHLAAIAIERRGESYEEANTNTTSILLEAARQAGVQRFIYMSQNGASSASPFRFLRSKGIAEDRVRESDRSWTIFRPSVIFGRRDEFVTVLARLVRLSPVIYPVPGGGTARFQPVAVDDVARAVAIALERPSTVRRVYHLGGPAALTLRQMVQRVLLAMGAKRLLVGVPVSMLRPVVAIAERVLPRPPVTTGLLDLLALDNTTPNSALVDEFGIVPTPFAPEELVYLRMITVRDALRSLVG